MRAERGQIVSWYYYINSFDFMNLFEKSQESPSISGPYFENLLFIFFSAIFTSPVTALEFPQHRELKTFTAVEVVDPKFNPTLVSHKS